MNTTEKIKQILKPSVVVQHYLGQPIRSNTLGLLYKSPFRNERTASFLVNDIKGIHDFGTSKHYDIISFVQELFRIDFKTAINKLSHDFGIMDFEESSKELTTYLIKREEEKLQIKRNLNTWFYNMFNKLCNGLHMWQKILPHLRGEALKIGYIKEQKLDYLTDVFINASDEEKILLWKDKEDIERCLR